MLYLEKMGLHSVEGANYVTSVNGMAHPDRVLEVHDFLYMLDGNWEIYEEEERYELENDDLLVLAAGRHHYGKRLCNPGNRHMYIHVQPTEAERSFCLTDTHCADIAEPQPHEMEEASCLACQPDIPSIPARLVQEDIRNSTGTGQAKKMMEIPPLLHCRKHPKVRQYFHEIIAEGWSASAERENRRSLLFSMLLCELADMREQNVRTMETDPLVEEISELVRTTPQTFFSTREMSKRHFICERTLNNHFIKASGKTFSVFQMETKLEMARQFLLSQPQAKLHEAAVNYGFYDEFHLSKAFKKKYGIPPSEYRRRYSEKQQNG
ncbi:MAG: AraC family transcriptional regulator [Lachnospiraceae bacterium]|nr:AraC family transcriptional regulator [Lachnospiraceae bacterium]